MTRFTKSANGKYVVSGKSYDMLIGTRAQVWHGTAYKTSGGLNKNELFQTKAGRIVSKAKHFSAKKENRLVKAGYGTKKGKFGYVKLTKTKSTRGGGTTTAPTISSNTSASPSTSSMNTATSSMNTAASSLLKAMTPSATSTTSASTNAMSTTKGGSRRRRGGENLQLYATSQNGGSRRRRGGENLQLYATSQNGGSRRRRGGNGVSYPLSPSNFHGKGMGNGVDLQLFATSQN